MVEEYIFNQPRNINGHQFTAGDRVKMERTTALWFLDKGIIRRAVPSRRPGGCTSCGGRRL